MIAAKTEQGFRPKLNRPLDRPIDRQLDRPIVEAPKKDEYPPPPGNLALCCVEPPHLKYNMTTIEGGVLLSIWEPAPKSDVRVKPFLFMTRHRLASELEAKKLLAHYLSVYRKATQRR
jgi:hypothetical protein